MTTRCNFCGAIGVFSTDINHSFTCPIKNGPGAAGNCYSDAAGVGVSYVPTLSDLCEKLKGIPDISGEVKK